MNKATAWTIAVVIVIAFTAWLLFGIPNYIVYTAWKNGQALLMKAEQEKKIQIEQAKAELESATLRAKAIEIVWEASKRYPEYRTQEFIGAFADAMSNGKIEKIIYVPTEANIPIIEARN